MELREKLEEEFEKCSNITEYFNERFKGLPEALKEYQYQDPALAYGAAGAAAGGLGGAGLGYLTGEGMLKKMLMGAALGGLGGGAYGYGKQDEIRSNLRNDIVANRLKNIFGLN